jgi:hypothetical protein
MARRKAPHIPDEVLDQLLSGTDAAAALQEGGLVDGLKKALAERALNAEMDHHLGGEAGVGNSRNGYGRKTVTTDSGGRIALEVPRDRQASFDPQLIAKYQRRFPGFDEKIVSMYARGMSTREIAGHLLDLYGLEVSPDLVSAVTDAVLDEIATWQARPLEPVYPLVFFDALRVKIRDEGLVRNKAVGSVGNSVFVRSVERHGQAMARVKRWPKSTANWALAMAHSRGGILHSRSVLFKTRYSSFSAASSAGKWPLERTALRSLAFSASMALVV